MIVLRFDANMAVMSVSPIHQSTPLRRTRKSANYSRRERERLEQHENPLAERIVQQKFGSKTCLETAMNPQIYGDDSALHNQSVFDTTTCTGLETKQTKTQRENISNNSLPLRANCSNDQHYRVCHSIHLSEEPEQTALDQSKDIATNPDSVRQA